MPTRTTYLAVLSALVGSPYRWGGKGTRQWVAPGEPLKPLPYLAFDCMGLVLYALNAAGGPDLTLQHSTSTLEPVLPPIYLDQAKPGDLLFFATNGKVDHVEVYAGNGSVIGARGGGRLTLTLEDALEDDARVDWRAIKHLGRPIRSVRSMADFLAD